MVVVVVAVAAVAVVAVTLDYTTVVASLSHFFDKEHHRASKQKAGINLLYEPEAAGIFATTPKLALASALSKWQLPRLYESGKFVPQMPHVLRSQNGFDHGSMYLNMRASDGEVFFTRQIFLPWSWGNSGDGLKNGCGTLERLTATTDPLHADIDGLTEVSFHPLLQVFHVDP